MQELRLFVEQMRATSSSLNKVEILKQQSEFIQKVLEYTYNPSNNIMLLVRHVRKTQVYLSIIHILYIMKVYLSY